MAYLWEDALRGDNSLPFFVDSLSPGNNKQNLLEEGNPYFVDDDWVLTGIPDQLKDGIWIMSAKADIANTSPDFLSFTVDRMVDVYVAYDASAGQVPAWLNEFTPTGLKVYTNGASDFNLYTRSYNPGQIVLGGNLAAPASGELSNYLVIIKEMQ